MNKGKGKEVVIVPRTFVLLDELEKSEKGQYSPFCSVGIKNLDDMQLRYWNGFIIPSEDSIVRGQDIRFDILCDMDYPDKPPTFKLVSSRNVLSIRRDDSTKDHKLKSYFTSNGTLSNTIPILKNWNRDKRMIDVLAYLKTAFETNSIPYA